MTSESKNEIGIAPPRGRPRKSREDTERYLSEMLGKSISPPAGAVVSGAPETCPACGSARVMWGCDPELDRGRDEIHPLVWHEVAWMADSYVCRDCEAGWVEPDEPEAIAWVRPYWTLPS